MKRIGSLVTLFIAAGVVLVGCSRGSSDGVWSDSTSSGGIANSPIAGKIDGEETGIPYVRVENYKDVYAINFANRPKKSKCFTTEFDKAVRFLMKDFKKGTVTKQKGKNIDKSRYHAYYNLKSGRSMNFFNDGGWSGKVVISEIDKEGKTVKGWAEIDFDDGKTSIAGSFEGDICLKK